MRRFLDAGDSVRTRAVWRALSPLFALTWCWDILRGKSRSFGADATKLVRLLRPTPQIEHVERIPTEGPFVVVTNHYCRRGLGVWWGILLIGQTIARLRPESDQIRWVMTNQWTYQDPIRRRVVTPLTRWLFHKIARSYGFVPMPPMPPNPSQFAERAQAVRRALALAHGGAIIGLAPEGRESGDSSLIDPPAGVGRFLLLLTKASLPILPVGVAEKNGTLTASFGEPFVLKAQPGLEKRQQDQRACETAMVAIGKLLPIELGGVYRKRIAGESLWPD